MLQDERNSQRLRGMVLKCHREYAWVQLLPPEDTEVVIAKPRGKLELRIRESDRRARESGELAQITAQALAPGDRVTLSTPSVEGHCTIESVEARETWLLRQSEGRYQRRAQLVVANADLLVVVAAPNPTLRLGTVDRYFLAARQGGLQPVLVVNKIDLYPDLQESLDIQNYRELGYAVFFTQATSGKGVMELLPLLTGKLSAFCGHSGVGKSTLLSQLTGRELKTGKVRERDLKGRQTTVTAEALPLPDGGWVVDTPGVREFGLAHLDWLDVHEYFSDIAALTLECAFRDCSHSAEPDCAVVRAVTAGRLSPERLKSYRRLRREVELKSQAHWK